MNKTVVLLLNGRPTSFGVESFNKYGSYATNNNLINSIYSLLMSYHCGEQCGNALIDIIFGKYNPSGRLSSSWPQSGTHSHELIH